MCNGLVPAIAMRQYVPDLLADYTKAVQDLPRTWYWLSLISWPLIGLPEIPGLHWRSALVQ